MPPSALIWSIAILAILELGMPANEIGPVKSVAIPTLIGPAACAHLAGKTSFLRRLQRHPPSKPHFAKNRDGLIAHLIVHFVLI